MAVAAAPLLEREPLLADLREALDASARTHGRLVLVAGEAGVGKTALVRAFVHGAGTRVLEGACDPLFTPRPLAPIADVAAHVGGQLEELVAGGARAYEVLGVLLDELRRTPTTLVLEDLHWADEATLDLLRLLARRISATRSLVVATYRDDELGPRHPLRIVIGGIVAEDRVTRLWLPPLSRAAVGALAEAGGRDADALFSRTGGNAFFVTEALAAETEDVPPTVRDAVLARAATLAGGAREVLEAVAVAPPRAELWLVDELCDGTDGLDECLASGMLVDDGSCIAFRHELARIAVEESVGAGRSRALHRLALRALENDGAHVARLAHHAEAADDAPAVLRFAPVAAERAAAVGAHREAAAHFARAIRFGDALERSELAHLLDRLADERYITDEQSAAIEARERAIELHRQCGETLKQGESLTKLSSIMWCPGRTDEYRRLAGAAVELLETAPPGRELAAAYTNFAGTYLHGGRMPEARIWANRALELAERVGETETAIRARVVIGMIGGPSEIEQALERAHGDGLDEVAGRVASIVVGSAVDARDHACAKRHLEPGIEFANERGLDLYRLYLTAARARLELEEGRWTEATDWADAVLRTPKTSISPRIDALVVLGLVRARRGDPDASAPLEEAWALAEPTDELPRLGPVASARAELGWLCGDVDAVAATCGALDLALDRESPWLAGELAAWHRRAGLEAETPACAAEPWARQLAGDWPGAAASWRRLGCPYEEALALAEVDDDASIQSALEILEGLGARPAVELVARRLRARGVRVARGPRPATSANAAGLTTRELDVLRLVGDGLRNAEIAEQLFLSTRTIDHHVSAILRKLQARTRLDAVSRAADLGLLQRPT